VAGVGFVTLSFAKPVMMELHTDPAARGGRPPCQHQHRLAFSSSMAS
jgi:hypothetical protein